MRVFAELFIEASRLAVRRKNAVRIDRKRFRKKNKKNFKDYLKIKVKSVEIFK